MTDRYASHDVTDCFLDVCERHYCRQHKLLWRECETALQTMDGAGRTMYEVRDCPDCQRDIRNMAYKNYVPPNFG